MKRHEAMLRDAGLRVTRQRVAVLEYVEAHPHCAAEEVVGGIRAVLGRASVQAVYDALSGLATRGLVRRIEPAGSPTRYETRAGDNHHHVVCRDCGRVEDVDCTVGEAPCLTPSSDHGFDIDEAEIVFWGRCAQCRTARDDAADSPGSPGGSTQNLVESQLKPQEETPVDDPSRRTDLSPAGGAAGARHTAPDDRRSFRQATFDGQPPSDDR